MLIVLAVSAGATVALEKASSEATIRLFESIKENNFQGVKINVIGGADLYATNRQNMTPIDLAIEKGYFDIVYYLLAYRESREKVFSSKNTEAKKIQAAELPAPRPPESVVAESPAQPATPPRQPVSAVASIYKPPPGSAPWSATVVTPDPSVPQAAPEGPSPFDPGSRPPGSGLTIIGDIRGPPGSQPEPVAAAVAEKSPVAENTFVASAKPAPTLPSPPPLRKPMPPERKVAPLPQMPSLSLSPEPLETAQAVAPPPPPIIAPVPEPALQTPVKIETPAIVEPVSATLIKPQPAKEIQAQPKAPQRQAPPEHKLIPVETSLPGKPKDERGLFGKIMSALSFGDEEPAPKQIAHNRVILDMPPPSNPTSGPTVEGGNGWVVRKIEKASPVPPPGSGILQTTDPTGARLVTPLKNVTLSLVNDRGLGQSPPKKDSAEFNNSCIEKKSGSQAFCIVELKWPENVAGLFAASTILYDGTSAIVRYDEGAATYYHTLFPTESFSGIIDYFTARYGPPTKNIERSIAPLASPRVSNPTAIWLSVAPVTKLLTTLEIRTFDDSRGGFPDTRRGVALLYHEWSRPVFPDVSTVELMMLSAIQRR